MPSHRLITVATLLTLLTVRVTVLGQGPAPRAEMARPAAPMGLSGGYYQSPERMESLDPDAKLGAGDRLTLVVEEDREQGIPKVVSATGEIDVFPIKGRVKVSGKTTTEAAAEIKRLLEKDYYYTATVKLSLDSRTQAAKAGSVTISGEVRMVGPIDLLNGEKLTVSQAVLKAGGFGPFADQRRVQVTRTEGGSTRQFNVDVKFILGKGAVDKDVILQDGDRINIPRATVIF